MTRGDIADHLGLTVETVSRLFSKLKRDEIVELPDAHAIVVQDWTALKDLSEGAEA
jgi:CRP/FNR family transcriptional regulator